MKTHVDTANAIRMQGTDVFLTRRGALRPMGPETLFLDENEDETTMNTWLGEAARARPEGEPEVVRVSRVVELEQP